MVKEVKERVELIVSVQGSRQISQQSLDFLYEKYELTPEEREEVQQFCQERGIRIFDELENEPQPESKAAAGQKSAAAGSAPKKGFFARLFGR